MASQDYMILDAQLKRALSDKKELMNKAAALSRDYKKAFAKKELELKANGIATTILKEQTAGDDEIADLKFEWDCAEIVVECNQETINVLNIELKGQGEDDRREWRMAE